MVCSSYALCRNVLPHDHATWVRAAVLGSPGGSKGSGGKHIEHSSVKRGINDGVGGGQAHSFKAHNNRQYNGHGVSLCVLQPCMFCEHLMAHGVWDPCAWVHESQGAGGLVRAHPALGRHEAWLRLCGPIAHAHLRHAPTARTGKRPHARAGKR